MFLLNQKVNAENPCVPLMFRRGTKMGMIHRSDGRFEVLLGLIGCDITDWTMSRDFLCGHFQPTAACCPVPWITGLS